MGTTSEWSFFNKYVQSGLMEGRFLNAAYTLIAAGPPRLASSSFNTSSGEIGDIAWPLGVLQSLGIGQNSQVMRLYEIGSERSYFIKGRTAGQINLGRGMFHGPSLLRALYAYMGGRLSSGSTFEALYPNAAALVLNTNGQAGTKQEYVNPPGYGNMWIDLASDVFGQPTGLLFQLKDSNEDTYGAFYAEYCNVVAHGLQTDAGGTMLSESATLLYERLVPVNIQVVDLIKDSSSIGIPGLVGSGAGG